MIHIGSEKGQTDEQNFVSGHCDGTWYAEGWEKVNEAEAPGEARNETGQVAGGQLLKDVVCHMRSGFLSHKARRKWDIISLNRCVLIICKISY